MKFPAFSQLAGKIARWMRPTRQMHTLGDRPDRDSQGTCGRPSLGDGRLYFVDAPSAKHGRRLIAAHRIGSRPDIGAPPMKTVLDNGRIVAIGTNACLALAGASEVIRHWNARLARDGTVRIRDTTALGGSDF